MQLEVLSSTARDFKIESQRLTKQHRAACRKMFGGMQCLPDGDGGNGVRVSAHLANRGAANGGAKTDAGIT
jgi:hypothetical protein